MLFELGRHRRVRIEFAFPRGKSLKAKRAEKKAKSADSQPGIEGFEHKGKKGR
ncbi:hypothetical protein GCM10010198_06360 [Nocardia seriolae]|nr:hypothetical protein NSERKGN1266_19500 [Nocardia seriolae]GEM28136.1 hypothetical protein NS2_63750 [Nocardia seriolae NBRC 15557]